MLIWFITGVMAVLIAALSLKIWLMRQAAREITRGFDEKLLGDTNTLISISSRDREMRALCKAINRELKRLRTQRLRYQQGDLELKAAMTNISHDLRTPLTAICGYLDMLQTEVEISEDGLQYLEIIRDRAGLLRSLTEELFQYSLALDAGELAIEQVDVNSVLEASLAAAYTGLTGRGIEPEVSITQERIIRPLCRAAVNRVFSNLLSNVIKYSEGDLRVTMDSSGTIVFSNHCAALSQVDVEQLFHRFYTVEAARNSTGLGLSIAQALMERMGGRLWAEYSEGCLRITVSLPKEGAKSS